MDREIWRRLLAAVRSADRRVPRRGRRPRYSDQQIVKMLLWTIWHDRPLCWACDRSHYSTRYRPMQLPSVSQFCRRVRTERVTAMLRGVHSYLARGTEPAELSFLDGKPLPVSNYSGDPDARDGYAAGGMRCGYKLHAWATDDGRIPLFIVRPLNEAEPKVARQLVPQIPPGHMVLADGNYDSALLYQALAERDSQLLTPLKGRARSAEHLQRMPAARRRAIDLWDQQPERCQAIGRRRVAIERIFSALSCFGGGLAPLPHWVRRLPRVERWVTAKLAIYHARLLCRKDAA